VVDPCASTVINSWVINPRTVKNGEKDIYEFTEATDTVQVYNNVPTLCGAREYTVLNPDGTVVTGDWVKVAPKTGATGTYQITSSPMLEALEGLNSFKLRILLTNYKGAPVNHAGLFIDFTV
jgi:hypothetical protein